MVLAWSTRCRSGASGWVSSASAIRLYRLPETKGCEVREHGKFKATDFDAPLIV